MSDIETITLPTAVYGTLREGHGNDRTWKGLGFSWHDGECTIEGYRLVGRGFPYAIPAEGQTIVVGIIVATPGNYEQMLAATDMLEGYPTHYNRVKEVVHTPEGDIFAWLYTPDSPKRYEGGEPVPGNDWAQMGRAVWQYDDDDGSTGGEGWWSR